MPGTRAVRTTSTPSIEAPWKAHAERTLPCDPVRNRPCAHSSTTARRTSPSTRSRTRRSSGRPTPWSGSRRPTSAAATCTCTRAAPTSSRARSSATRTWARSSRSATASTASRSATWSCCPSTSAAASARTARPGRTGFCLTANPGNAGAAYGYADMGPYNGGQAELLRVPYADWNALVLPDDAPEKEKDYVMLSDILPTGYHGTELAQVGIGDSVVIYGAGPVGLMAAMSANLRGADQVFVVDRQPDRLKLVERRRRDADRRQRRGRRAAGARPHPRRRRRQGRRGRRLPGARSRRPRGAGHHDQQPHPGGAAHRPDRRGRRVRARGPERERPSWRSRASSRSTSARSSSRGSRWAPVRRT